MSEERERDRVRTVEAKSTSKALFRWAKSSRRGCGGSCLRLELRPGQQKVTAKESRYKEWTKGSVVRFPGKNKLWAGRGVGGLNKGKSGADRKVTQGGRGREEGCFKG